MMAASGLQGKLVTLIGGSGYFGSHVAQELLSRGARLRIASRHPQRSYRLRPLANLGQIQFVPCDVRHEESLRAAMSGAAMVVNLVGAFDGDLDAVQGRGIARVAATARDAGCEAFVHISAIGADPESEIAYQRSKGDGERAVVEAFPSATILRPSILFGQDDDFLNMFGRLVSTLPVLPVFAPDAKLQPVFVDDAALAVIAALENPAAFGGQVYELAGPETITMLELNQRVAKAARRSPALVPLPDSVGGAIATLTGWLPGAPISRDQFAMLAAGNVAGGTVPDLRAMGIAPRPMTLFLDRWMTRYRKHGRFGETSKA